MRDAEDTERRDDPVESGGLEDETEGDLRMPLEPQEEPAEGGALDDEPPAPDR